MEAPEEFTWLFRHEYAGVVWSANLVLHDYALAEETAQDAFVRLLENWRKGLALRPPQCVGSPGRGPDGDAGRKPAVEVGEL